MALIANINVDINDIVDNILKATKQIITATKGGATNLNQADLATLVATIQSTQQLVANIEVSLKSGLSTLPAGECPFLTSPAM